MQLLTGPLSEALKQGRESFNARFVAARKTDGRIDGEAFLCHLAEVVDPVVRAVAADFAEKTGPLTEALYDLSLDLFGAALLGPHAKSPAIADAWQRLLPRMPRLIAREPARVAGSIANAVYNLAGTPGTRMNLWLDGMADLAQHCTSVAAMLDCGKVLAWRAGMVQYRDGAIAAARQMEPSLAAKALGVPASAGQAEILAALERMAGNPWITPAEAIAGTPDLRRLRLVNRAGAFRGFGGTFLRPPLVRCQDGHLVVSDGQFSWILLADVHGVVLHRIGDGPLPAGGPLDGVKLDPSGSVRWGEASATVEELAGWSSAACDGRTLAVGLPTSHHVFLLARG